MACDMTSDRLWAWVQDEEDDPAARAEIAAHVESCEPCREQVAEMRAIVGDLSEAGRLSETQGPAPLPEEIGGYRILRRIGQGGMGVVYEAEQREPRRRVAVKVILGGRHISEVQRRLFQREVQTLARLNHPAIAAIYEAGRTDDGNHFFAMELVEGKELLRYLDGDRTDGASGPVPLPDRLRLFRRICDGISYAHQRGVIHRDLKPSNILIVEEASERHGTDESGMWYAECGTSTKSIPPSRRDSALERKGTRKRQQAVPKILDFGLARIVEEDAVGGDGSAAPSLSAESGRLLGTLPYMSPEQTQGRPELLDVRSDVYSLGVILYQMLTGTLPYDLSGRPLLSAVRIICEQSPARPGSVHRSIPDEVETIVLKALEKEPARRYQSTAALADDVERYLGGYPIAARRPSSIYQLRKLVTRHKATSGLAALLLLSVCITGVVSLVQARRIAAEAATKTRIIAVLESLYEAADPWRAGRRDVTVRETLDAKAAELEAELADDPLVAAAVRNAIGNTYKSLSESAEDMAAAERHLLFAYETRRDLLGWRHAETAESANDLGELRYLQGRYDDAERLWREALAARASAVGPESPDAAETLNNLGVLARRRGDSDEAQRLLYEALRIRRRTAADESGGAPKTERARRAARNDVAQTLNNLAGLHRDRSTPEEYDRAEQLYREALEIRTAVFGEMHPEIGKMYNNLGKLLQEKGDLAGADQALRQALAILRREGGLGQEHQYIARLLHSLAEVRMTMGDLDAARALCDEALDMRMRLLGDNHPETAESKALQSQLAH